MYTDRLISIIKAANQLRFDMDKGYPGRRPYQKENVGKVYQKLEEGKTF